MKTIYLAGPINGCTDSEANDWRERVIGYFQHGTVGFLNPMRRDYRGMEATSMREIVQLDKRDINCSDILLVRYLKPSVGTSMEIYYAWERDIPVIVWADPVDLSPWLVYHSTKIASGFEEAMGSIKRMVR